MGQEEITEETEALAVVPKPWRVEVTQDCWQVFWVEAATHDEAQAIANGVRYDQSDWEYGDVEVHADWSPSEPDEYAVAWVDGHFVMADEIAASPSANLSASSAAGLEGSPT